MIMGAKITFLPETCWFGKLEDKDYFSAPYAGYVSNSRLGLIDPRKGGTPEKYFEGFNNSLNNQSFMLGSAVHCMTLQEELFELSNEVFLPSGVMCFIVEECYEKHRKGQDVTDDILREVAIKYNYYNGIILPTTLNKIRKAYEEYASKRDKAADTKDGKDVMYVSERIYNTAAACIKSLTENKAVQNLLKPQDWCGIDSPTYNENAVLLDAVITFPDKSEQLLKLKSKLDNFTIDEMDNIVTINDVKTTGGNLSEFHANFLRWSYQREFAMYSVMLKHVLEKEFNMKNYKQLGNALVVETATNEHLSGVYKVSPDLFRQGLREFAYLLKMVAYFTKMKYGR